MTKRSRIGMGLIALCLLVLSAFSPFSGLLLKFYLELFAVGDSLVKVYLFLLLVTILGFLPDWQLPERLEKYTSLAIFILLLIGLGEQFFILDKLGLPITTQSNFVLQGDYSTTRLDHIHVPKAALGMMLSSMSYQFDAGIPYHTFLPGAVLWPQLLMLLGTSAATVLCLLKARQQSAAAFTEALLIWFVLMKATVDGGLLNAECVAVLPLHLCRVWGTHLALTTSLVWVSYLVGMQWAPGYNLLRGFHLGTTILAVLFSRETVMRKSFPMGVGLVLCMVAFPGVRNQIHPSLKYNNTAYNLLPKLVQKLKPGEIVYANKAGEFPDTTLAELQEEKVNEPYRVGRFEVKEHCTVYKLCRHLKLNTFRAPLLKSPQRDRIIIVQLWEPGSAPGDFQEYRAPLPAGASINYVVAGMPEGSSFRSIRMEELNLPKRAE